MPEEIAVCNPWLDVSGVNIPVGFVKVESVFIAQMLVCDTGILMHEGDIEPQSTQCGENEWWRYRIEKLPTLLALGGVNPPTTSGSPTCG